MRAGHAIVKDHGEMLVLVILVGGVGDGVKHAVGPIGGQRLRLGRVCAAWQAESSVLEETDEAIVHRGHHNCVAVAQLHQRRLVRMAALLKDRQGGVIKQLGHVHVDAIAGGVPTDGPQPVQHAGGQGARMQHAKGADVVREAQPSSSRKAPAKKIRNGFGKWITGEA
jgi:hypothetical protein